MIWLSFVMGLFFGVSLGILVLGCLHWFKRRGEVDWVTAYPHMSQSRQIRNKEIPATPPDLLMSQEYPRPEARRHQRFKREGEAMVSVLSSIDLPLLSGPLLDISEGGLALLYFAEAERMHPDALLNLEINATRPPFLQIGNLSGRIVYELETDLWNGGSLRARRCGVQFGELTAGQFSQLQSFIQNCTACEV